MTWIAKLSALHLCQLPEDPLYTLGTGSLWQCDDCIQLWRLHENQAGKFWVQEERS
jgi:hypothetical protein